MEIFCGIKHPDAAHVPAFQASPTCGFAVFSTHEANAMQTRHMSDCLSGRNGASNPSKTEVFWVGKLFVQMQYTRMELL